MMGLNPGYLLKSFLSGDLSVATVMQVHLRNDFLKSFLIPTLLFFFLVARVRASKASNSVYDVKFDPPLSDEEPPPIFGAKYNFHLEGRFLDFFNKSRRKRGLASNPLFNNTRFFLHFPNELCYGYLRS